MVGTCVLITSLEVGPLGITVPPEKRMRIRPSEARKNYCCSSMLVTTIPLGLTGPLRCPIYSWTGPDIEGRTNDLIQKNITSSSSFTFASAFVQRTGGNAGVDKR